MNVLIQYTTRVNLKNGRVEYVNAKAIRQRVVFDYGDGRVRTETGDVWHTRRVQGELVAVPRMEKHHEYR